MNKRRREYLVYLLRLWRENDEGEATSVETSAWRASLERPQASERQGFASLKDLFAFLERETRLSLPESEHPEGGDMCNGQ